MEIFNKVIELTSNDRIVMNVDNSNDSNGIAKKKINKFIDLVGDVGCKDFKESNIINPPFFF